MSGTETVGTMRRAANEIDRLRASEADLVTELIALRKRFHVACVASGSSVAFAALSTPGADAALAKAGCQP